VAGSEEDLRRGIAFVPPPSLGGKRRGEDDVVEDDPGSNAALLPV
jgi:hypothetical protein